MKRLIEIHNESIMDNIESIDIKKTEVKKVKNMRGHYEQEVFIPVKRWVNKKLDIKSFTKNKPKNIRNINTINNVVYYDRLVDSYITPKEYERLTNKKFIYDRDTFYIKTTTIFKDITKPTREPDYISASGSEYWYNKNGVIRNSDHWGVVASCLWQPPKGDTGFSKWVDFRPN